MSDDLWTWACAAYAAPGVSEACLSLQDYHEQNVPLLLWAAWTAITGRRPDEEARLLRPVGLRTQKGWDVRFPRGVAQRSIS